MVKAWVCFGVCIAMSFFRNHGQQHGAIHIKRFVESLFYFRNIVPIDRSDIFDAKRFKPLSGDGKQTEGRFQELDFANEKISDQRDFSDDQFHVFLNSDVGFTSAYFSKIF